MLRKITLALALTTGLIWGMVGCSYMEEKDAPLDIWIGQVQQQQVTPAVSPAALSTAYPREWSPIALPPIQISGLAFA